MERLDVTFDSGGERCAAWLYRPDGEGPHPCVVMGHGIGSVRHMRLPAYAERFARAGLVVLLFDYRHFGDSEGEPRELIDVGRQVDDFHAALRFARSLDGVDTERIALFGSSFGGGHVMRAAAEDRHVAAAIAQCPFTDGIASLRVLDRRSVLKVTVAGVRDRAAALLGREPVYVGVVGPPGSRAGMTTPDAEPGVLSLVPPDAPWHNRFAARLALTLPLYRPGRAAARVQCPLLVQVCDHDSVAPAGAAIKAANRAPHAELKRYPIGHFDIYWGDAFERAVTDQVEFLHRHLGARESAADPAVAQAPPS